jgi:hypothetical protein
MCVGEVEPIDLNEPPFIEGFIGLLYQAAGVCDLDAHMLREVEEDGRVWEIAAQELRRAAARIEKRTAGLASVQRCEPDWKEWRRSVNPAPSAENATKDSRAQLRLVPK